MDRKRDLPSSAPTRTEPTAAPTHVHRGLAEVDMGISGVTPAPGPEAKTTTVDDLQTEHGIRTRLYRDGSLVTENFPVDEISDHLEDGSGCVVWLDLCAPDSEQLGIIGTEFGLHKLAIEDALDETQRTKLDRYSTHLFMAAHSAQLDPSTGDTLITNAVGHADDPLPPAHPHNRNRATPAAMSPNRLIRESLHRRTTLENADPRRDIAAKTAAVQLPTRPGYQQSSRLIAFRKC